ncbi:uncharacterized protein KY384_007735 [Bacidia gigantensis]|uniref:uncharacterized protein n=1 Tax=Bacidia gigantensis TaxID=2732470 RepID=UPI001D04911C|nr:uncharacterized protein KY384_007735 [Bacidia gigantensis]KAG8527582.1 hypothetical protein KY384_007735 [Bacidia gigantensis]
MDSAIDLSDASKALDLSNIRFQLVASSISAEPDNIHSGGVRLPGSDLSLFDWILREQEALHSLVRRYESPDEYPFFPDALNKPILQPLNYPKILHPNDVNVSAAIKRKYIEVILPRACPDFGREDRGEQQENYGSTATIDVSLLQALSRRIHFGKFVAESKFQAETERFVQLVKAEDRKGIDEAITNAKVEKKVLERLRLKARTYGKDPSIEANDHGKINVDAVVSMYEVGLPGAHTSFETENFQETVIPLTKEVEVEYLMQRLIGTEWE